MADTKRTYTDAVALIEVGGSRSSSAQDVRDCLYTIQPEHGSLYMDANATATTIGSTASWYPVSGAHTLVDDNEWDENTNGQLRYTGDSTRLCQVTAALSFTVASGSQVVHFAIAKNGTPITGSTQVIKNGSTGTDSRNIAIQASTTVTANDYLTVVVKNTTGTNDVTVTHLNMTAISFATV